VIGQVNPSAVKFRTVGCQNFAVLHVEQFDELNALSFLHAKPRSGGPSLDKN
jgi:hypothetical protein